MVAAVGLLISAVVGNAGVARAHDHQAPIVQLRAEGLAQDGIPREIWWVDRRSDDECVGSNAVGPGDFPQPMAIGQGEKARVRLQKSDKPKDVSITMWRGIRVGEEVVLGPPGEIEFTRRRRKGAVGSTRAWDAVFQRPGPGDYYYEAFADWRDRQGCGGKQGGYWRFSLSVGL